MEAVIAMFLVVVMVGAVFSALMSSRRAIVTSSEREEVFYTLKSTYGLLKDCRSNPNCQLSTWNSGSSCPSSLVAGSGAKSLKQCNNLFTFNFGNLCKENVPGSPAVFQYTVTNSTTTPEVLFYDKLNTCPLNLEPLQNFYVLDIQARCTEAL